MFVIVNVCVYHPLHIFEKTKTHIKKINLFNRKRNTTLLQKGNQTLITSSGVLEFCSRFQAAPRNCEV